MAKTISLPRKKYTQETIDKICKLYLDGLGCVKIGKIMGIGASQITEMLNRSGVKMRTYLEAGNLNRKYTLDENYFENIDSEEKAYWLGFITADGCVETYKMLSIMLSSRDKDHLVKLQKSLNTDSPVRTFTKKSFKEDAEFSRIRIHSANFIKNLTNKGVCERKSLVIKPYKNISKDLVRHYVRGLIDGNGTLCYHRNSICITICGTKYICKFFKDFAIDTGAMSDPSILKNKNKQLHYVTFEGNVAAKNIIKLLYRDSKIYLERKMIIAKKVMGVESGKN